MSFATKQFQTMHIFPIWKNVVNKKFILLFSKTFSSFIEWSLYILIVYTSFCDNIGTNNRLNTHAHEAIISIFFLTYLLTLFRNVNIILNSETVVSISLLIAAVLAAVRVQEIYLPTPPLEQDMTQGQFLSGV